jgi:hypothetical protein
MLSRTNRGGLDLSMSLDIVKTMKSVDIFLSTFFNQMKGIREKTYIDALYLDDMKRDYTSKV